MTPDELKAARARLGLKAAELGRRLELEGRDPGQQVLRWEKQAAAIPGPAAVAVRYMLDEQARQRAQEAHDAAQAAAAPILAPAPSFAPTPPGAGAEAGRTRRRG